MSEDLDDIPAMKGGRIYSLLSKNRMRMIFLAKTIPKMVRYRHVFFFPSFAYVMECFCFSLDESFRELFLSRF